jgi:hypothetical protein
MTAMRSGLLRSGLGSPGDRPDPDRPRLGGHRRHHRLPLLRREVCAAIMHEREPEALTEAEVRDGWRELVNMIGGNLKARVAPVSRLGPLTVLQPRR